MNQPLTADRASTDRPFRSGFVGLVGKANAGKSTLLNRLVGRKIAIVSDKPQTTRHRMVGIAAGADYQICFVDTPGILRPRDKLNEALIEQARRALEDIDLALHIVDATDRDPLTDEMKAVLGGLRCPLWLVINKVDLLSGLPEQTPAEAALDAGAYAQRLAVSALTGAGCDELLERAAAALPEGPPYFPQDDLTDRDMRFIAAETVREKAFTLLGEEVPYSVATKCEEFREHPDGKHFIRVVLFVERESQKKIVIGQGGATIRRIGAEARAELETLLDHPVFLELWVKVRRNWRKSDLELKRLGLKH
ncbi:MAG: GTPase Era [Candidatus Sumerlaeia bacterium]